MPISLSQCERCIMWPTQTMLGIISLLPKAKDAERPVCKCAALHRVYCKARGRDVDSWTTERAAFWDAAIRGSSALVAALLREVGHEVASYMDMQSI
eukprot:3608367-Pyramimonas_sp.AAC.1